MKHASLFSGIGGAELAAAWMGWRNLFHCEIGEFPRKVLEYWFPNSVSYEDITTTDFTSGEEKSTSSLEGSPVNRSQWQESDLERKMTATSGHTCCERYARYSPLGSLVRTLLASQRWYSPARRLKWAAKPLYSKRITERERSKPTQSKKSAKILSRRDIQSSRLLFQLVPSVRPTGGTGYGLLPTVQTQGLKTCENGKSIPMNLALLPTPLSVEVSHAKRITQLKEKGGKTMGSRANGESRPNGLMDYIRFHSLLPTPIAMDKNAGTPVDSKKHNRDGDLKHFVARRVGQTSLLNPLFVTEMMGLPLDWLTSPFQNGEQKVSKP